MQTHALKYWENGNKEVAVGFGWVDGLPFVVTAQSEHWIPVNHLVFAKDSNEAIKIIKDALLEIAEKSYQPDWRYSVKKSVADILALNWSAEPYNKTLVSHVQWAGNDDIV